jgi:cytoskeletal protein CcmA (bactofilin family)
MALFNKEPEKSPKIQTNVTPQAPSTPPSTTAATPTPTPISSAPAPTATATRANGPVASDARAYLDRGSKISGKLSFDSAAKIDGEVEGEIVAKEGLTIGDSAVVTAQIRAASVTIAGKVSGDITASQRIEIKPSAKVNGNITAPVLVVHEGALFEGHCSMQPEAREERKVTVFPKEERAPQVAAGGQKSA